MSKLLDSLKALVQDPEIKQEIVKEKQAKANQKPQAKVDYTDLSRKPKNKVGGLSLEIITAIQQIYAHDQQLQQQGQNAQAPQVGLNPGWGGQGR